MNKIFIVVFIFLLGTAVSANLNFQPHNLYFVRNSDCQNFQISSQKPIENITLTLYGNLQKCNEREVNPAEWFTLHNDKVNANVFHSAYSVCMQKRPAECSGEFSAQLKVGDYGVINLQIQPEYSSVWNLALVIIFLIIIFLFLTR